MTVATIYYPNPFDGRNRELHTIEWRQGLTVADCVPARLRGCRAIETYRRTELVYSGTPVEDGDVLLMCARPGGLAVAALGNIGATGSAGALAQFSAWWGATAVGKFFAAHTMLAQIAVSAGIYAAGRLLGSPGRPTRRGDEESPFFGFSGPGNIRVEGQPIPIVYGRVRYAGTIVHEFTRTRTTPPRTDYYSIALFSEGPIQSIDGLTEDTPRAVPIKSGDADFPAAGVQLNGNDVANLDGIALAVRLGTDEQEPISGPDMPFNDTQQSFAQSVTLASTETTSQDNTTRAFDNSNWNTSTADTHFTSYAGSYSFTDDFDGFRCVVSFPSGLYRISLTGNIQPSYADFAIRYRELDGSGTPITTGGPEGDGWVRLPLEERVTSSQRSPFSVEFEHRFFDPQTYTHPTGGKALDLDGSNDYASKSSPSLPSGWASTSSITTISMAAWVYPDTLAAENTIFDWSSATRGFRFRLENGLPTLSINTGASYTDFTPLAFAAVPVSSWSLVAFSLAAGRVKIWVNNSLVLDVQSDSLLSTHDYIESPGTGSPFQVGRYSTAGFFDGRIDELELRQGGFTQADIATRWATGVGAYIGATSAHVGLWHFDTAGSASAADSSTYANTLTLNSGANVPSSNNGKILGAPSATNDIKSSRYQVQIVRVNNDSTHPNVSDQAVWTEIVGTIAEEFSYPGCAVGAIKAQASEQLNTTIPTQTSLIEGRLVPVWDELSQTDPTFADTYTRNPAWIAVDVLLNKTYGLGREFGPSDIDVQAFKDLADYADQIIYDHQGQFDATADWTDITYTGSGGTGTLTIQFTSAGYTALRWSVGDYVALSSVPVPASTVDINSGTTGGYLISAMDADAFTVTVDCELSADPWTSGTTLSADISPTAVSGQAEGREPRYCFDGVFDTEGGAWDRLHTILATARAVPIRKGRKITVAWERPRDAIDIVGIGSIVAGSWRVYYGGSSTRHNSLQVEFKDEDQNYDRSTISLTHTSVQNVTTLDGVRRGSISLPGCTRRSQALRHAAYLLNVNHLLRREGEFVASIDTVPYEVGDVLSVSHDVSGWGVSGRVYAADADDSIKLGRTVTLAAATTYTLSIRNPSTGIVETKTVNSSAGTYSIGTAITTSAAFSFVPAMDDAFVLTAAEKLIQITGISLTQDLRRKIRWIEYSDSVYEDDWFDDIDALAAASTPALSALQIPTNPTGVTVSELVVRGPGNNFETHLQVSWGHDEDAAEFVAETALLLSLDEGPWEEVARVAGKTTSADVKIDRTLAGSVARVAVQPISSRGARRRPDACANASAELIGVALAPTAPSDLSARMDGELCVYSFTANDSTVEHEIRRGGWILGQPVARVHAGSSSTVPTPSWAGVVSGTYPTLYCRAANSAGFFSDATSLDASLAPAGVRNTPDWITAAIVAWHNYVDGWRTASSPPAGDPVLTGFEAVDDATHGDYLKFDGSSLVATYETAYTAPSFDLETNARVIRAYVEAWTVAEQVHPLTIDEWDWPLADPAHARWTLEGPTTVVAGESANCTLKVQIDYHDGSSWSGWQDMVSGAVYSLTDAKFRLYATRPSTDYDVRVRTFLTRIRTQSPTNNERTDVQAAALAEIIGAL